MLLTFYFEDIWLWEVIPPWNCDFLSFFLHFYWTKKTLRFLSCYQFNIFKKYPSFYIWQFFILYFSAMFAPPPLPELFISMLFSINPNRNIRSSSQIRQNSQVFHYSWFIAKWAHVLGKLSNMIRAFPTFCSGEKFPFQTSQSTIQNS